MQSKTFHLKCLELRVYVCFGLFFFFLSFFAAAVCLTLTPGSVWSLAFFYISDLEVSNPGALIGKQIFAALELLGSCM